MAIGAEALMLFCMCFSIIFSVLSGAQLLQLLVCNSCNRLACLKLADMYNIVCLHICVHVNNKSFLLMNALPLTDYYHKRQLGQCDMVYFFTLPLLLINCVFSLILFSSAWVFHP